MRLITLLALAALAACGRQLPGQGEVGAEDCRVLPILNLNTARQDAAAAYKRDDRHLIGIYGFTSDVPGVASSKLPVRMIEATSDSNCLEENRAIRRYAATYNRELERLAIER